MYVLFQEQAQVL